MSSRHLQAQNTATLMNCPGGEGRPTPIDVHISTLNRRDVTAVLVCTDGLSNLVQPDRLALPARHHSGRRHLGPP